MSHIVTDIDKHEQGTMNEMMQEQSRFHFIIGISRTYRLFNVSSDLIEGGQYMTTKWKIAAQYKERGKIVHIM